MTDEDRQAIVSSAFAAIRRMVPNRRRREVNTHLAAALASCNDQTQVMYQQGYDKGREEAAADAYEKGKIDGMLVVERRADRRDVDDVKDPEELRSVH